MTRDELILGTAGHIDHAASRAAARSEAKPSEVEQGPR
jgi:hypothetical protein